MAAGPTPSAKPVVEPATVPTFPIIGGMAITEGVCVAVAEGEAESDVDMDREGEADAEMVMSENERTRLLPKSTCVRNRGVKGGGNPSASSWDEPSMQPPQPRRTRCLVEH